MEKRRRNRDYARKFANVSDLNKLQCSLRLNLAPVRMLFSPRSPFFPWLLDYFPIICFGRLVAPARRSWLRRSVPLLPPTRRSSRPKCSRWPPTRTCPLTLVSNSQHKFQCGDFFDCICKEKEIMIIYSRYWFSSQRPGVGYIGHTLQPGN